MKMRNNILIILATVLSVITVACENAEYKQINGVIWNTTYHITYKSDKEFTDSVINTLRVVERSVSAFDSKSIVSQVNRNEDVELDSIFRKVYLKSVELNKLSFGYFDPTVSPLINAMGFGYEETENVEKLDSLLDFIGISKSRIEGNRLVKDDSRLTFNFSAIAKGFGSDEVAEMFRRNGVNDFIVEIGGEVVAHGKSPRGGAWNVAIESPSADFKREAKLIVELENKSMATSGDYRNFKVEEGKKYSHIVNPITGRLTPTDIVSATIVTEHCIDADAFATSCVAMGSELAKIMVEDNGIAAYFILDDMTVWSSSEFKKLKTVGN